MPSFSANLEQTLHRALAVANERGLPRDGQTPCSPGTGAVVPREQLQR